ncbi:MAG: hypothetical protein LQ342_007975 [Letrouitia transgressa]|nr:MAG: hypothetical protein LQ342_007975 [Letrouitia transgressa]
MADLVAYGSSDESEADDALVKDTPTEQIEIAHSSNHDAQGRGQSHSIDNDTSQELPKLDRSKGTGADDNPLSNNTPSQNKSQQNDNGTQSTIGPQRPEYVSLQGASATSKTDTPYSSKQALIRNLTLPPIPSLDIPPSPPGSPPPNIERKFENFIELKKQNVHFNQKLASSSALKNPMLLKKLMKSAGLEETDQYATVAVGDSKNI